jgi:hypothetical protein
LDKFLHEINFQLRQFTEKTPDFELQKLKNEVVRLINKSNSLCEDLDYRRIDYSDFEKKMEEIKIEGAHLVEKMPEYFF